MKASTLLSDEPYFFEIDKKAVAPIMKREIRAKNF